MPAQRALDTTIAIVTPENIQFDYQLAGPFRRLPAFILDVLVLGMLIAAVAIILFFIGVTSIAFTGGTTIADLLQAAFFVIYFLLYFFYSAAMETVFNGRTVGKWVCGIRTLCADGRPISAWRAWMRNLLRVADAMPVAAVPLVVQDEVQALANILPTFMIGLLAIALTPKMQRIGDLVSGTMVVVDERSWRLPVVKVDDRRVVALATFIPGDYRVSRSMAKALATYAERRAYLAPARRREIAKHLTEPLLERFEFRDDIDPDLLLYALYYKTFLAESSTEEPSLGEFANASPLKRDMHKQQAMPQPATPHNLPGPQPIGPQPIGPQPIGPQPIGAQAVGAQAVGAQAAASGQSNSTASDATPTPPIATVISPPDA
ncbi:MAG: RDD family protein [Planctomycetota bacterium]